LQTGALGVGPTIAADDSHGSFNQAYPAGKYFTVPPMPNVTAVNALGDFVIAADRLAIIDGEGKLF
jgi:hypothetical protein